jgi:hypothetical protein
LTRFLDANRSPPRIKSGAGFRLKTLYRLVKSDDSAVSGFWGGSSTTARFPMLRLRGGAGLTEAGGSSAFMARR